MANETLSVATNPIPHGEILAHVKPALEKEGIDLKIREFTDYIQPNVQLAEKQFDANFIQHQPYMDTFNKERGTHIVSVGAVHIEPFAAYSKKIKDIKDLKDGATIAVPNDPSNGARALLLLEKNGLIKLKDPSNTLATAADVTENPKKLKFKELDGAMLPRVLDDVDLALINTNYALEAGLNPVQDALLIEDKDSPYANLLAVNKGNENDPKVQKLLKALQSEDVKKFISDKYKGAIVPAF
nr:MetQ/NlpA family ABC transporter substrate-binding protein [Brackiella oedipodis]